MKNKNFILWFFVLALVNGRYGFCNTQNFFSTKKPYFLAGIGCSAFLVYMFSKKRFLFHDYYKYLIKKRKNPLFLKQEFQKMTEKLSWHMCRVGADVHSEDYENLGALVNASPKEFIHLLQRKLTEISFDTRDMKQAQLLKTLCLQVDYVSNTFTSYRIYRKLRHLLADDHANAMMTIFLETLLTKSRKNADTTYTYAGFSYESEVNAYKPFFSLNDNIFIAKENQDRLDSIAENCFSFIKKKFFPIRESVLKETLFLYNQTVNKNKQFRKLTCNLHKIIADQKANYVFVAKNYEENERKLFVDCIMKKIHGMCLETEGFISFLKRLTYREPGEKFFFDGSINAWDFMIHLIECYALEAHLDNNNFISQSAKIFNKLCADESYEL